MQQDHTSSCGCVNRTLAGKVTPQERDEILALFERKNGLIELTRSLVEADDEALQNTYFYEKLVADMGRTVMKYQQWWSDRVKVYRWENIPGHSWEIDFDSCQVFLVKNEC